MQRSRRQRLRAMEDLLRRPADRCRSPIALHHDSARIHSAISIRSRDRIFISARMMLSRDQWLKLRNWAVAGTVIVAAIQIALVYPFFAQTISEMPKPWELGPARLPADGQLKEIVYPKATMNRVFGSMFLGPAFLILFLVAYWSWRKARNFSLDQATDGEPE